MTLYYQVIAGSAHRALTEDKENCTMEETTIPMWGISKNKDSQEVSFLGNGKPMEVNDGNFEKEVLDSSTPVLVDFWAAWCGPCRMVAPELEKLAEEESDRLKVAKLNVDDNRGIAARYGISSIPTMILFKDGKEQKRLVGARSKARILEEIIAFI